MGLAFITADCHYCGAPEESLTTCAIEGCSNGFCDRCIDLQPICDHCKERVCEEHIHKVVKYPEEKINGHKVTENLCSYCLKHRWE
jgi:hypothetical protein